MFNPGNYILHIIAMILLISIVKKSAYMERARNLRYNLTCLCVCVCLLGFIGRDFSEVYSQYIIGIISEYFVFISILLYFIFFIGSLVPRKSKMMMFWEISGAILIVCTLSSPFTGLMFNVSKDGHFERGVLIIVGLVWMVAAYITLMVVNFKRYGTCEFEDKFRLVILFIFEVIAILIQLVSKDQFQDAIVASALITILYYAFVIEIESKYDHKTGVFSSTYYDNYVNSVAKKGLYSLIMYDVNGLKYANDNFGHEKGDELIESVAFSIKKAVGKQGKVFRLGGDEFVAVVKSFDEQACNGIVEKSLKGFEDKSKEIGLKVSAAYGVAVREENEDAKTLIARADKKMYECKQAYYEQDSNNRRGRR